MFAYCGNRPAICYDPDGKRYVALPDVGSLSSKKTTQNSQTIKKPEELALDEMRDRGMSFYRDAMLIRVTDGMSAFTFCYIFMGANGDENLLKHEYGHIVQSRELGVIDYGTFIVLPSVAGYCVDSIVGLPAGLYYSLPWEYKADEYGGAFHNYKSWAKDVSDVYWAYAKFMSLLTGW